MSTNRVKRDGGWVHPSRLPKGPNGRALCRQCGTEVPKGRRTFCGDPCVDAWKIKTDPGHVRRLVFRRDRGVCALCGVDTVELRKMLIRLQKGRGLWPGGSAFHRAGHPVIKAARGLTPGNRTTLWDADHIVPVVEGGGECDLDNYRTLCIWCHRDVTAALRRRLAERRRAAREEGPTP